MHEEQKRRSGRPRRGRRQLVLTAPEVSGRVLVRLEPASVGMFRFLLEACDHLAGFTVLDRRAALLKVFFSPHQAAAVRRALHDINDIVPLEVQPWPSTGALSQQVEQHSQCQCQPSGAAHQCEQAFQPD